MMTISSCWRRGPGDSRILIAASLVWAWSAVADPGTEESLIARDAVLPVRVAGVGLGGALADAQQDIPVRAVVERCSAADHVPLDLSTDSGASPEHTLQALLDAYRVAGGLSYEQHADTRIEGRWVRLQETGCSLFDTPIDLEFTGSLNEALQPWADALSAASGEPILLAGGIRSGGRVDIHVSNTSARAVLLQILDADANDSLTWSYQLVRSSTPAMPGYWVGFFPVRLDHDPVGSVERGSYRDVDGVRYFVEPEEPLGGR